jgi:glycosyltransferase involved in cell wall biosynthesis
LSGRKSKRMLVYTLHCGNLYGTERMALVTLKQFPDCHRVVMAPASAQTPSLLEVAAQEGYECYRIDSSMDLLRFLARLFWCHRSVDLISTSATHNLIAGWVAIFLGVRIRQLNVVHGGGDERYSYANKKILNLSRVRLIAVSEFVRERLNAHGVLRSRIDVIENFVLADDVARQPMRPPFDVSMPVARPLDRQAVRVIVVSRVDPFKRLDVLMSAIDSGRLPMCRFDVYGDGPLLEQFRSSPAVKAGFAVFHGHDDDIPRRLAESDFLVHTCPAEPFGLVALEAFRARLPVIVPNAGGMSELVEPGLSGFAYEASNSEALVACLLAAIDTDLLDLDRMTLYAQQSLAGRFGAARGAAEYRSALENA